MGYTQSRIALLIAAFTIGGLMLQFPLGWVSDRMSRRGLGVGLAAAGGALMMLTLPIPAPSGSMLLVLGFAIGGLVLPAQSIVIAHVNDRAPARRWWPSRAGWC